MPRKDTGNNSIGESQDLDDQNQLGEGAYLINDQILALLTANGLTSICLIKALRVLILDIDDALQDQLGEWAYLTNDQIPALFTANGMYFHMFNQGTESNHLIVDEIRSFA